MLPTLAHRGTASSSGSSSTTLSTVPSPSSTSSAELLTEEGRLLQQIQGENNDIDAYAARLDAILQRKQQLITILKAKLDHFRGSLQKEEQLSKIVGNKKKGAGGY